MPIQSQASQRSRGIYLLPNLLTTAGLFAGFYAIVAAMKGHFPTAAVAIYIAMIADALDGRVARLTNTQTAFGVQYDSLCDMVSFGIAPALVMYHWALVHLGKIGWLAAFIYAAAGALRLARFNTQVETYNKGYFQGLAIPSGAGILAGMVWTGSHYGQLNFFICIVAAILTIIIACLMVSNIRYLSFKDMDVKGRIAFPTMLVMVLIFVGIAVNPAVVLFTVFLLYGFSGPVMTLMRIRKVKIARRKRRKLK